MDILVQQNSNVKNVHHNVLHVQPLINVIAVKLDITYIRNSV